MLDVKPDCVCDGVMPGSMWANGMCDGVFDGKFHD